GYDVYAQHVSASGTPLWTADGVLLCNLPGEQLYPAICGDGAGGAIIAWWDARGGDRDVYAQRLNSAGVPQWTANGVLVAGGVNDQLLPRLLADGANGAFVAWEDHRAGGAN